MTFRKLFILAALMVLASPTASAETAKQPKLKIDTLDGKHWDLAAHRGHWVVINYWATWCAPCIAEMPELSAFIKSRPDVDGIGLAFEDTERQEILDFLEKNPVDYPIAQVEVDAPPADFDIPRGLPTTYLIAPDGSVAKQFLGPIKDKDLEQAIKAAKPVGKR
ncbi:MAG: TlpA disulfide reductase family protein [Dokdonella sp.]